MLGVFMSVCGGGHGGGIWGAREGDTGIVNKKTNNFADIPFFFSRKKGAWDGGLHNRNGRKNTCFHLIFSFFFFFFCHRRASHIS